MLTIPCEALPATMLGQDIKGDARIAGLFSISEWEDTSDPMKCKLRGQLILPTEGGNTRSMDLSCRFQYTDRDYVMKNWSDIFYDMKLAIKREAWVQFTSNLSEDERNQRSDKGYIECGLLFQYPVVVNLPVKSRDDMVMATDLDWITATVMDDPGKGRIPEHNPIIMHDGMVMEKSIDLVGIDDDPLTPEDPAPGRI